MMIPEILIQNTVSLPVLGLGTWEMGGRHTADTNQDRKWIEAIETAIGLGIRHIDTAAIYGAGQAERLIGEAIRNFDRSQYFITTKVSGDQLQFNDVLRSAKASKNRLRVDQIDMLQLHWPNPSIPLSQTMSAINKLLEDNIIRYFGLSNFPTSLITEIGFYTDAPIMTNQLEYNLFTRNTATYNNDVESVIIPFCLKKGISITAWRPLMKGAVNPVTHPLLVSLSGKYAKTPFQIMLNWLVNKPQTMAIPKMSSAEHIQLNVEALNFTMESTDYLLLDQISSVQVSSNE